MTLLPLLKRVLTTLAHAFAWVSSGETLSAAFARHLDRMGAQPLNSDIRDMGNLELSLDVNFSNDELKLNLRQGDDILYKML